MSGYMFYTLVKRVHVHLYYGPQVIGMLRYKGKDFKTFDDFIKYIHEEKKSG